MQVADFIKKLDSKIIVGIDEVGRGCWAGPMVVGAVILDNSIIGLTDSKLIPKAKRKELARLIRQKAIACSTGWVSPAEVDSLGLTAATKLGIERAIENIKDYDYIIIDGSINYLPENTRAITLIKADSLISCVSAASIIAKVARDEYMEEQALQHPNYGFEKHVGYGTAEHKKRIIDYGVTPLHRLSYKPIKELVALKRGEQSP